MFDSFIKVTTLALTLQASFFLIRSNFKITPESIANLTALCDHKIKFVTKEHAARTADTRIGGFLLFAAFCFQITDLCWSQWDRSFGVNRSEVLSALVMSMILFASLYCYAKHLTKKIYIQVIRIHLGNDKICHEKIKLENLS